MSNKLMLTAYVKREEDEEWMEALITYNHCPLSDGTKIFKTSPGLNSLRNSSLTELKKYAKDNGMQWKVRYSP